MENKFTQGRWNINKLIDGYSISSADDNQNLNIPVAQVFGTPNDFEGEANAKLIAAAPELLEALNEVAEFLGHIQPKVGEAAFNEIWDVVESAIKKATE